MIYRDTQQSLKALYAQAARQGGYFTAKQAAAAGYNYPHLSYHLQTGNFERANHGLYRLTTIPVSEDDELIRLSLWSRDREDRPQSVVSHSSALFLHHLSDVLPAKTHLTVPQSFRKRPPSNCIIHKALLTPADVELREGYSVTTPLRSLIDAATGPGITDEQFEQAVHDALQQGLVRESVLKKTLGKVPTARRHVHFETLIG